MLTVVIPTFNNENSIEKVIKSAREVADNIIVIDSFSNDNTVEIATKYGARIFQREYNYSANQKNYILDKVTTEWVMILDSDELLSDELALEIRQIKSKPISPDIIAYRIPFILFLWGKPEAGITEPKIKLFRTNLFRFEDKLVHASPVTNSNAFIKTLEHPVYHFGIKSMEQWFHKTNIYTTWDSIERNKRKKAHIWEFIFKPPLIFLEALLKDKAIFFGLRGFIYAVIQTITFLQILLKHYELRYHSNEDFMRINRE